MKPTKDSATGAPGKMHNATATAANENNCAIRKICFRARQRNIELFIAI